MVAWNSGAPPAARAAISNHSRLSTGALDASSLLPSKTAIDIPRKPSSEMASAAAAGASPLSSVSSSPKRPAAVRAVDSAVALLPLQRIPTADRPYFAIATAYAVAGDASKATSFIAQYRRDVRDSTRLRLDAPALEQSLGAIALASGNGTSAIEHFRRGDIQSDGMPAGECASCIHIELARAFDVAGQTDSAAAEYEAYIATPFWGKLFGGENGTLGFSDGMVLAGTEKRLGELYEAKGDTHRAIAHYANFVTLWKDADPVLQPKVAEVRQRMARLNASEAARR